MIDKVIVNQLVDDFLKATELYLVDLKITTDSRIMIEIDAFDGVSLDDCIALHRHLEAKIDREVEDYELEVSSAGLTEPFKVLKQYLKNLGKEVEVLLRNGKKMSGVLQHAEDEKIIVQVEKTHKPEGAKRKMTILEDEVILLQDIKTTKLIIRFK